MFLTNQHGLKESDRGSAKQHLYKIIWKSAEHFRRRRFFKFSFSHIGKTAPPSGGHVFLPINMAWRNLIEGHQMNISTKLFENRLNTFGEEDFLSFLFCHKGQIAPSSGGHVLLTNQHGLKESDRGSPNEHFYKIIWKSAWHFLRRRFFKFSL